jgi:hypothetical protein
LRYFEAVFDGTTDEQEQQRIANELGFDDFAAARNEFLVRLERSRSRLRATQEHIRRAAKVIDDPGTIPTDLTTELSARYHAILDQLPGF